jgi:hypothetical protein
MNNRNKTAISPFRWTALKQGLRGHRIRANKSV